MFRGGLAELQGKVGRRFYTTTLDFARDLCDVICKGVNHESGPRPREDAVDGSPTNQTHGDDRERRRLGKRILKAVQPLLDTALQTEAMVTSKPLEELSRELEAMLETCIDMLQPSIVVSQVPDTGGDGEDTVMADAPVLEITVAGRGGEDAPVVDSASSVHGPDAMDTSEDTGSTKIEGEGRSGTPARLQNDSEGAAISVPTPDSQQNQEKPASASPVRNGIEDSDAPPATNGYVAMGKHAQKTPPTPPQSTDSVGHTAAADPLTEGGIPWYLRAFDVVGTTAAAEPEEEEASEQERARSPSEELTDLDDAELTELAIDVEAGSITASLSAKEEGKARPPVEGAARARTRSSARKR